MAEPTHYWCNSQATGFQIVKLLSESNGTCEVEPISGSLFPGEDLKSFKLQKAELHATNEAVNELVYLKFFSAASVVNSLRWRFQHDHIYTNAGLMTIAVNPFKKIDSLYSEEQIINYSKSVDILSRPHVYGVAQTAYRRMKSTQVDQTILVSGLSGSGKTETVKFTIHYLSTIAGGGHGTLEQQINVAGLLLESFGNATTLLNANSSRFGKYTRIYFDKKGQMSGAEIKTYLLEKSRVSNVPENEKNFHIFYHLLNGLKDAELVELFTPRNTLFAYLPNAPVASNPSHESLELIRKQLQLLGFTPAEQASMFKILFGILHLGNVQFEAQGDESAVTAASQTSLWNAAALLGVSQPALQKALTTLELKSSNKIIALNKANAELSRDSLAKDIYERLFDWIVKKMNATISLPSSVDRDDYSHVSILDISGYETSSSNSLEQLCINFTNDKLQQLFNTYVYKEQELYEEEGLNWTKLDIDLDLRNAIALVENKPDGIFGILDQVCYRLDANDDNLLSELSLVHKSQPLLKVNANGFSVQHGPGPVAYGVGSFLVKNRDVMASALENLMSASKEQLLASLFTNSRPRTSNTSVTSFFCKQLSDLLETIGETDCSYIKCIRPNADSQSDVFDSAYVRDQIKWCGVVETITLCDKGYPSHLDYSSFLNLFSELPSTPRKENASPRDRTIAALQDTLKPSEYALGKTKLFLAMGSHFKLDLMLESVRRQSPRDAVGHSKSFWQRTRETWSWMFS